MEYLGIGQIEAILKVAYEKSRRDHLLLLLSAMHGLRASEAAALTIHDVSQEGIRVKRVKGSLETFHPLMTNSNILFDEPAALKAWLEERSSETDALFPSRKGFKAMRPDSVGKIAKIYMQVAGIPEECSHHHSLKHFCCSSMSRAGVGVEFIKKYVGHAAISSTIIYLGISNLDAAKKAQSVFEHIAKGPSV